MGGTASGVFGFGQTISRAEFVTVLARMFQWDTSAASSGFSDTKGHWAEGYLAAACQHGAIDKGALSAPTPPSPARIWPSCWSGPWAISPWRSRQGAMPSLYRRHRQQGIHHRGL